tara:strand:- start:15 stop:392 length:378 start_codon:yes stop_codon:yes gene_type:complete
MTSSKPYLVRALYDWILDNDTTPYVLIDVTVDQVQVPPSIASDGKLVLNLAPQAIENLDIHNDYLSFTARFSGVAESIYCPMSSLLAIYARENGEGMMFPSEDEDKADNPDKPAKPRTPNLKVIK